MNRQIVKSRDLKGCNRCGFRRERDIQVKDDKGVENVYEKAVLIKDMIRKGLFGVATDDEIEATLEMGFMDMDYPTPETAKLHAADAYRQVMRYLKSETRTPEVAEAKIVHPFDLIDVRVSPDYIFTGIKEFPYEETVGKKKSKYTLPKRYIEVVKIRCSKPNVSITGSDKDSGMKQCLELYSMLLYARSLVKPGETVNVCASYYFLRKNSDSSLSKEFDPEFFQNKGAGNVVTLWEEYTPGQKTELDLTFEPQFKEFVEGEDVEDEKCDGCDFYELCHFSRPPKMLEDDFHAPTPAASLHLTPAQQKVVGFRNGTACVNAGAGAGKTASIALRTAQIIKETGRPDKICMLTFTNTGAEEMRNRIRQYAKEMGCKADISKLTSTTFNAFGYDIVKKNYEELGFTEEPKLIDDVERSAIIADLLKEHVIGGLDYRNFYSNMKNCRGALAVAKKAFEVIKKEDLEDAGQMAFYSAMPKSYIRFMDSRTCGSELLDLYEKYNQILKDRNLIEYADQEMLVFKILENHPGYFMDCGYEHFIVDEFQDTNGLQFTLLQNLINTPDFKSFMVVGDDSQSIFAFRGSSPDYIINFFGKLGVDGDKIQMIENHRSTPQIIDFANKINAGNKDRVEKDLVAVKPDGQKVSVRVFWKRGEDTEYAVEMIQKEHAKGTPYEDIAYIAYTRSELMTMSEKLSKAEIPWIMINPEPLLENPRVKAALSLVKFINDPDATKHALIYINAVHKGDLLSEKTDEEVKAEIEMLDGTVNHMLEAEEDETQAGMFLKLLSELNDEDEAYENFMEMVKAKEEFDDMLEFCRLFEIYGADQSYKRTKSYPGVVLTTAHSSKGKEWPVVINSISKYHTQEAGKRLDSPEFQERRRILFVSATRAKDRLYITGQAVAYGSKRDGDRVLNQLLIESCEAAGVPFPAEPEPEKKKKTTKAS